MQSQVNDRSPAIGLDGSGAYLLSVILPLKEPDVPTLARCIASFDALPSAPLLELVVVRTGPLQSDVLEGVRRIGRMQIIECSEPGIYTAFNRGIDHAAGRFLLFFGHDDIALPEMEPALRVLAGSGSHRLMLAGAVLVEGVGVRRPSTLRQGIVFRNWGHQGIFYAASLFRERRYDTAYPLRADHRVNISLLADRSVEVQRVRWIVSSFSLGGFSTHTIADARFDAEQARIAADEFGWIWGVAVRFLVPTVRLGRRLFRGMAGL